MYYYFSAAFPAVIKLNGVYYGSVSDTIKACRFENTVPFIEICPLNGKEGGMNFLLDRHFLNSPPDFASVTDLKGGYLIKFKKKFSNEPFRIVAQRKFPYAIVTVFAENGLKLSIETQNDFFAKNVEFPFETAEIFEANINGLKFLAVCYNGKTKLLSLFRTDGKIEEVFSREIYSYSFNGGFSTTEKFIDVAKHEITVRWDYDGAVLKEKEREVKHSENFSPERLPEKLRPYVFLEELLVGGKIDEYLSESVKENSDKLSSYLGKFTGIMPPPAFRRTEEIGLIYNVGNNKYSAEYFVFEIQNGKICNIKKSAD